MRPQINLASAELVSTKPARDIYPESDHAPMIATFMIATFMVDDRGDPVKSESGQAGQSISFSPPPEVGWMRTLR